jgi:hypothetical protein
MLSFAARVAAGLLEDATAASERGDYIEHVTVMSGTFEIGIGDKLDESKTMRFPAGSVTIMQPKTTHFGVFNEETILQ